SKKDALDDKTLALIEEELADILIYLLRMSDKLEIDLEDAVKKKIEINEANYPVDTSYNSAAKYNRK
ncbi:MazG-like family protein, partial [Chloroflexota bacterium]